MRFVLISFAISMHFVQTRVRGPPLSPFFSKRGAIITTGPPACPARLFRPFSPVCPAAGSPAPPKSALALAPKAGLEPARRFWPAKHLKSLDFKAFRTSFTLARYAVALCQKWPASINSRASRIGFELFTTPKGFGAFAASGTDNQKIARTICLGLERGASLSRQGK